MAPERKNPRSLTAELAVTLDSAQPPVGDRRRWRGSFLAARSRSTVVSRVPSRRSGWPGRFPPSSPSGSLMKATFFMPRSSGLTSSRRASRKRSQAATRSGTESRCGRTRAGPGCRCGTGCRRLAAPVVGQFEDRLASEGVALAFVERVGHLFATGHGEEIQGEAAFPRNPGDAAGACRAPASRSRASASILTRNMVWLNTYSWVMASGSMQMPGCTSVLKLIGRFPRTKRIGSVWRSTGRRVTAGTYS